ncbi:MAG: hypothetical protein QXG65_00345 [Thermoplasmata archaeon]
MTEERRIARAFAPGHVTTVFRRPPAPSRDPRGRGSIGAGLVLAAGALATARWMPGEETGSRRLRLRSADGDALPITRDALERLLRDRRGTLEVEVRHELPVGQGFGMSAAGTLAATLAASEVLGLPRSRAVALAHLADYSHGGGLGGVAAILGGGFEIRRRPGIPPWGTVEHRPGPPSVIVGVAGRPLPTVRMLARRDLSARLERASPEWPSLVRRPTLRALGTISERFTDAVGVAPEGLSRLIRSLRGPGRWVAQAMFGRSFVAVPSTERAREEILRTLERRGIRAVEVPTAARGAHRLPPTGHAQGF